MKTKILFTKFESWGRIDTINIEKLPLKKRIIKFLSDFYSKIMGKEEVDTLGGCSICGCSVYFKSEIDIEYCPKNKWKK